MFGDLAVFEAVDAQGRRRRGLACLPAGRAGHHVRHDAVAFGDLLHNLTVRRWERRERLTELKRSTSAFQAVIEKALAGGARSP